MHDNYNQTVDCNNDFHNPIARSLGVTEDNLPLRLNSHFMCATDRANP